ncbi:MAG: archaeal proteasome endopeptidase complex subunit alpha [archaeon]|nr:archaeal proteasome endopeptidase complex subunit alpha [archaeon]
MFSQPGASYDKSITQFSPDGRLFQVEYAIEAVRRGTTAIALRNKDSVIFAVEKRVLELQEEVNSEKIFKVDNHVGVAIAGLTADARVLVDKARVQAQINILSYDEKISVYEVTREVCDTAQLYTQSMGYRPFGVSLLIGGIDPREGPKIYMTDPSGAFWGYFCCAIGRSQQQCRQYLEKNYKKGLSFDELMDLAVSALKTVEESELDVNNCDLAYIKKEDFKFTMVSLEDKKKLIAKVKIKE